MGGFNTIIPEVAGGIWNFITEVEVSNSNSVTIDIDTPYDLILLLLRLSCHGASYEMIALRINNDTGGNYTYMAIDGSDIDYLTNMHQIFIGDVVYGSDVMGEIIIQGKNIDYERVVIGMVGGGGYRFLYAHHYSTDDISSVTIYSTKGTNFNGKIEVWGRNL